MKAAANRKGPPKRAQPKEYIRVVPTAPAATMSPGGVGLLFQALMQLAELIAQARRQPVAELCKVLLDVR